MLSTNDEKRIKDLEDKILFLEGFTGAAVEPEPAKWCENIPDGGVLCWCWDGSIINKFVDNITKYNGNYQGGESWLNAKPLTKKEIQVFMDNASEAE